MKFEVRLTCITEPDTWNYRYVDNVEVLGVEEDFQGRDVLYFRCPVCGEEHKSLVWKV